MRPVFLLLAIFLVLFSCEKTETIDPKSILACHQSQQLDSAAIFNKLIGTWSLSSFFCYKTRRTNQPPIEVNFFGNGSFNVSDYSGIITQGTWGLESRGNNMWGLDMTPRNEYLYGRISFCKNQVLFDSTYVNGEGCYNLFNR